MQSIKVEHADPHKVLTPEKRAQNREKHLLTFVVKATARDQEKNMLISKLQREISEAVENLEALQAEVMLKDKILDSKEDELLTIKSENESLKRQLQQLLTNNNRTVDKASLKPNNNNNNIGLKMKDNDIVKLNNFKSPLKPVNNVGLKKNDNDVVKIKNNKSPGKSNNDMSTSPTPEFSRKRSLRKSNTSKDNVTNLFYSLRKKTKK